MSQKLCYVKDLKPGMRIRLGSGLTGHIVSTYKDTEESTVNRVHINTPDGAYKVHLFDHTSVQVLKCSEPRCRH